MVMVVYGFSNQTTALQFEWTWQHAEKSIDVKEGVRRLGKTARYGVRGKVVTLVEILNSAPWKYFPLKVRFLSGEAARLRSGCPDLPEHVEVSVGPVQDILVSAGTGSAELGSEVSIGADEDEEGVGVSDGIGGGSAATQGSVGEKSRGKTKCVVCGEFAKRTWSECDACGVRMHVGCLAEHYLKHDGTPGGIGSCGDDARAVGSLPQNGTCPRCGARREWNQVLKLLKNAGWKKKDAASVSQRSEEGKTTRAISSDDNIESLGGKKRRRSTHRKIIRPEHTDECSGQEEKEQTSRMTLPKIPEDEPQVSNTFENKQSAKLASYFNDSLDDADSLASRLLKRLDDRCNKVVPTEPVMGKQLTPPAARTSRVVSSNTNDIQSTSPYSGVIIDLCTPDSNSVECVEEIIAENELG